MIPIQQSKNKVLIILLATVLLVGLFFTKLKINNLLLAENGDTYSFFKTAYFLEGGNYPTDAKRQPLLPLFLTLSSPDTYVQTGRIIINIFYFLSIGVFYLIAKQILKNKISILATIVFALNIVVLDNSFYIMADSIFLFLSLLFLFIALKNPKNIAFLSIIGGLAFYTRLEGLFLFGCLGLYHLIKKNYKNFVLTGIGTIVITSPYFIRNTIIYGNPLYSGYSSDEAGFNINLENVFLAISNFIFLIGGFWTLPLVIGGEKRYKNFPLIVKILFISLSTLLILWSPAVRLYSVPISIMIIYIFYLLEKLPKLNLKIDFKTLTISIIGMVAYIIAVQFLDHKDIGLFKVSKAITILSSLGLIYYIFNKKFKKNLLVITLIILFINLSIFVERFDSTRYKYATIVEAMEYYNTNLVDLGKAGYFSESGVEPWYLKDFDYKYNFTKSGEKDLYAWLNQNDIKYIIKTEEMGYLENEVKPFKGYLENLPIEKKFTSPFFGGETKILEVTQQPQYQY